MVMNLDLMAFPGGKRRAFSLSYDDGVLQDRRLAELFRQYGLKCTFNLNAGLMGQHWIRSVPGRGDFDCSRVTEEELAEIYREHELGGHSLTHPVLTGQDSAQAMYEIIEDKRRLEQVAGRPMTMFAYPYGVYSEEVISLLRLAGYQGARTVRATHGFEIPEDFLAWHPTCHHNDPKLMELARQFVESRGPRVRLFYVWGHGYELDCDGNWEIMDELGQYLAEHREKIWFATNGEIMDYVNAFRRLEISVDGKIVYNPSAMDVWLRKDRTAVRIPAGAITRL